VGNHYFQGIILRARRQFKGVRDALKREAVGDHLSHGQAAAEDERGRFRLQFHLRAVAAEDFLFLDPHGRSRKLKLQGRIVMGKE
jgi:hypothetical protein